MAETLEESLRSMLDQIDPAEFEVVVVDGGSADGSRDILRRLDREHDNLRAILDRSDECNWLGGDRNISFEESRGRYVLESLDTDDVYYDGVIEDFIRVFHAIEERRDDEFFLSGKDINIAPRSLLLDVPYYDLGGAEDRDLWRRLYARDAIVWFDHGDVAASIGYDFDLRGEIARDIHGKICDFQSGVSFPSTLRWTVSHQKSTLFERERSLPAELLKRLYDLVTFPYAYLVALGRDRHPAPPEFREKGAIGRKIEESRMTLSELEAAYGFEIDRSTFSEAGRRAYVEYERTARQATHSR
jgi:glycosyltransferase involved in cell wall biosynthesis